MKREIRKGIWLIAPFMMSACASRYVVKSYPEGAKIIVQNVVSKENFEVGESPVEFAHESKFGEGFIVRVEKEAFDAKEVFVNRSPGAKSEFQINLKPAAVDLADAKNANNKDPNEEKDPEKAKPNEESKEELEKRLAVLERTFEIYKDALFSSRYAASPASYDRSRIDTSIGLVTKAQRLIEQKQLDEASKIVDSLLTKDEYLAQAHVLKGSIAYMKGDFDTSIRSWERALEINPYERLTRQYLISAYRKANRELPIQEAEADEIMERIPASSPLASDPLKLKLNNR